jgi:hypothetical protein
VSANAGHAERGPSRWPALERRLAALPAWLRPRDADDDADPAQSERSERSERSVRSGGRRMRIETIILLLVAATLCVAVVYDVTRQVKVGDRLTADIETWRETTGISDEEIAVEQDLASYSTVDTACGNLVESKEKVSERLCLMLEGPVVGGRRKVVGGFYLPPYLSLGPYDRYGCFGSTVSEHFCPWTAPPGLPSGVPKNYHGKE